MTTQNRISHCLHPCHECKDSTETRKHLQYRERENKKARNINLPTQRKLKQARGALGEGGRNMLQKTT